VRFTIRHFYPHLSIHDDEPVAADVVVAFFEAVCARTIETVVHWQRVGFVHGVMNTDNMSILGLTIDYGPYGFVDGYDPDFTPNTTDASRRRYRFGQQPAVALWNLARLAEALSPLLVDERGLQDALLRAGASMQQALGAMHRHKLGLTDVDVVDADAVVAALWPTLQLTEVDFTLFFRALADVVRLPTHRRSDDEVWGLVAACTYDESAASTTAWRAPILVWLRRYLALVDRGAASAQARATAMDRTNPWLLPRNWLAQEAIDAATASDLRPLERLLAILREPYQRHDDVSREAGKRPEWARHKAGCSMLSCSS
jgi:uncharacterized protein YdiU (UPF0061 family)